MQTTASQPDPTGPRGRWIGRLRPTGHPTVLLGTPAPTGDQDPGLVAAVAAAIPAVARAVEALLGEPVRRTLVVLADRRTFAVLYAGSRTRALFAAPLRALRLRWACAYALDLDDHVLIVLLAPALRAGGLCNIDITLGHELVHAIQFRRPLDQRAARGRAAEEGEAQDAEPVLARALGHRNT